MQKNKHNLTKNNRAGGTRFEEYKLNSENRLAKRTLINTTVGAVSLTLSILCGVYFGATAFSIILSLILLFVAIGFLTAEILAVKKQNSDATLAMEKANEAYFDDAEVIPVFSTEKMLSADDTNATALSNKDLGAVKTASGCSNMDLCFDDVIKDFLLFANERGCKIDARVAKSLFASLASSRILITKAHGNFELLVQTVSKYFGTQTYIDLAKDYTGEGDLLFQKENKTAAMLAIENAQTETDKLHFIALDNVPSSNFESYFEPFIHYARTPEATHFISVTTENATDRFYLPSNLWVILNLAEKENVAVLPQTVLEVASIQEIPLSISEKGGAYLPTVSLSYSQMKWMINKSKCVVMENNWKKLDAFVDFINQTVSFAIPNKQWLGMEKYIAVLNDCNESVEIALDEAIAVNIIPSVIAKAIKAEKRVDVLAGLSASFDSNEISISRKAVKSLGQFELHK